VMHRERNAANAAIVALAVKAGAMPHDLQAVTDSELPYTLERATSAPVIVVLGPTSRSTARAFKSFGAETVLSGVALKPGGKSRYSVIRDETRRVAHHVFHLPLAPVAASTAFSLLVQPLIARLQGGPLAGPRTVTAVWDGSRRAVGDRLQAVPVTLEIDAEARNRARPICLQGVDDLAGFARAEGLAVLPAGSGPWLGGEIVEVYRFV
jgi:molybdopterin biosynthesis enzyme